MKPKKQDINKVLDIDFNKLDKKLDIDFTELDKKLNFDFDFKELDFNNKELDKFFPTL